MAMPDIDFAQSEAIDAELFQKRRPFPWISVEHFLTGGGYGLLRRSLPEVALCAQEFDRKRGHHQASHDGYALQYGPRLAHRGYQSYELASALAAPAGEGCRRLPPDGLDSPSPSLPRLPVRMPCADLAMAWLLLLCVDGVYAQYTGKRQVWEVVFCSRSLWLLSCGASCRGRDFARNKTMS